MRIPRHELLILSALALCALPALGEVAALPSEAACAQHIAAFEGSWAGANNPAPFGPMEMAFAFARESDGSLRALSAQSPLTWIELHFFREGERWRLRETAAMEGLGEQSYTMDLVAAEAGLYTWEVLERPGFMSVQTAATADEMQLTVLLRGQPHVAFRLQRVPGDAGAQLAMQLASVAATVVRQASGADAAGQVD